MFLQNVENKQKHLSSINFFSSFASFQVSFINRKKKGSTQEIKGRKNMVQVTQLAELQSYSWFEVGNIALFAIIYVWMANDDCHHARQPSLNDPKKKSPRQKVEMVVV